MSTATIRRLDVRDQSLELVQVLVFEAFDQLVNNQVLQILLNGDVATLYAAFEFNYSGLFIWDGNPNTPNQWCVQITRKLN
jgi:uncharacterized protein (DUF2249 family)